MEPCFEMLIAKNAGLKKFLIVLSILFLIFIIVFTPLRIYIYNLDYYLNLYEKNGVYNYIDKDDAVKLTTNLFDFFKNKSEFKKFDLKIERDFFTQDEINHLKDVRELLNKIFLVYYICIAGFFITILILIENKIFFYLKNISLVFIWASSSVIFLLILIYFLSNNFLPLFEKFHLIFFPQGNWSFPEDSLLITLFPLNFFYEFLITLVSSAFYISFVFLIIGIVLFFISKKYMNRIYKNLN
jgi:integral membrane protein (TIGR01906 family)